MEKPTSVTVLLTKEILEVLSQEFSNYLEEAKSPYILAFYRLDKVVISIYQANKDGLYKALFQGEDAYKLAKRFGEPLIKQKKEKETFLAPLALYPMIGSDEVGTGDFFGGVSVAASYVKEEDLPLLEELGVKDSKTLSDEKILEITPRLLKHFPYSQLYLPPEKYNEVHPNLNLNAIKAKMHNRVLSNLYKKYPDSHLYIDQFCPKSKYFSYLSKEDDPLTGINFSIKGESLYPAVALSSVIARYSFLKKMEEMSNTYGVTFPFGSSNKVVKFAQEFLSTHPELLRKVAKADFKIIDKLELK